MTAFQTRYGNSGFIVVPIGMTNATSTFMCLMNSQFHAYLNNFLIIFIDDILIYPRNEEEHAEHLEAVL